MSSSIQMWRLDLGESPQPLFAVICHREQAKDPFFVSAQQYYKDHLQSSLNADCSTDVGEHGWSARMTLARSCLPDDLTPFHSMIVEAHGVAGFGLGENKECYERAAYLAHAITAFHCGLPHLPALSVDASSTVCLHADASRYDFTSEKLPPKNCSRRLYAVTWHIGGDSIRGYFDEDEAKASQRFHQLKGGPYAAALFDPTGNILECIGRYNKKHLIWRHMKAWSQEQLHGQRTDQIQLSQLVSKPYRRTVDGKDKSESADSLPACKRAKRTPELMQPCQEQSQDDVQIIGLQYDLAQNTELAKIAFEAMRQLMRPLIKCEPDSCEDGAGNVAEPRVGDGPRQAGENDGSSPGGSLNKELLRDIVRSERPRFRQLDPAQDASATRRWAHLLRWCDITDLKFRNTHEQVSPEFRHGPHAGLLVVDLVDSFMSGEERPEGLTPMVAAAWRGSLYVVFGNRRVWALLEFVRRHGPWNDLPIPKVRVIVHEFPFDHIEPKDMKHAFQLKALDAMSARSGGVQAMMRRR